MSREAAVYLCHCGQNIASTVDVESVTREIARRPDVAVVRHYPYLCSRPGQELIRQDVRAGLASRVVVAACSPRMHEATFRRLLTTEGVNPYLFRHINVREQCSWVHRERPEATRKAAELVAMGLARLRLQEPLQGSHSPVERRVLVLGGGPAGLAAALELGRVEIDALLVESSGRLGGRAADAKRSFPEGGDAALWLNERIREVQEASNVRVLTESRLLELSGPPGSFRVRIRTPSGETQAVVGAVIVATGCDLYRPDNPLDGRPELAYGDAGVATQTDLDRALRDADGPLTWGGETVGSVAFLQCIGSRDRTAGASHCSRICCQTSVRQAKELRERNPGAKIEVLYTDLRTYARGGEEACEEAARAGVLFRRGSASEVFRRGSRLTVRFEDSLMGCLQELESELVVLACGARPQRDAGELARILRIPTGPDGFFSEAHPKLRPVETDSDGIFLAGACKGPRTIDEAVDAGRAAGIKAAGMALRGRIEVEPVVAEIDADRCSGCQLCAAACPTGALAPSAHLPALVVESTLCKGCGACSAVCPSKAIHLRHFRPAQVLAEVEAASAFALPARQGPERPSQAGPSARSFVERTRSPC